MGIQTKICPVCKAEGNEEYKLNEYHLLFECKSVSDKRIQTGISLFMTNPANTGLTEDQLIAKWVDIRCTNQAEMMKRGRATAILRSS